MKAMILAAGLGTRLKPLTNDRPKALVEVAGRTLLEITITRLQRFGVREVIVNVHHFADLVIEYLKSRNNFGVRIEISREDVLLDTGGGLKKAAWFFLEAPQSDDPFVLHNVDVISSIDIEQMVQLHKKQNALATLAVQDRPTSRYLLFDGDAKLCGRRMGVDDTAEIVRPSRHAKALAFSGVHVISPRMLPMLTEEGVFSIITSYLRLAGKGEKVVAYRADKDYWRDLGKPENLAKAAKDFEQGIIPR
jgi:NDP-sugar pyrophosphorylase family protein